MSKPFVPSKGKTKISRDVLATRTWCQGIQSLQGRFPFPKDVMAELIDAAPALLADTSTDESLRRIIETFQQIHQKQKANQ